MKLLNIIKKEKAFLVVLAVFISSVLVIGLNGNFPINDDWIFAFQIESFLEGNYRLSVLIDPSYIVQGLMGLGWVKIFGFSFVSLRVLTFLVTILSLFVFSRILKFLKLNSKLYLISLITFVFNPIVFTSTFTFMSENYFLLFFLTNLYFYLKYFATRKRKYLILGTLFCGTAFLVRQLSLFTFIPFLVVLFSQSAFSKDLKNFERKEIAKDILYSLLVFIPFAVVWLKWPTFKIYDERVSFLSGLIEPQNFSRRIHSLWWAIPYFGIFILPLIPFYLGNLSKKLKIICFSGALILVYFIYSHDIFFLGNTFYLEGLYSKTDFRLNLSLFDNIPFKLFISALVSLGLTSHLLFLFTILRNRLIKSSSDIWLLLTTLLMGAFVIISSDYYERYLIPMFMTLIILGLKNLKKTDLKTNHCLIFIAFIYMFIPFALNQEYMTSTRIKWDLANSISVKTGLVTGVYVDGVYGKYQKTQKTKDFSGMESIGTSGEYLCFVQTYTLDNLGNKRFKLVYGINNTLKRYIDTPKAPDTRKNSEIPRTKSNFDKLLADIEYKSIIFNSIGKTAKVAAWCDFDSKE